MEKDEKDMDKNPKMLIPPRKKYIFEDQKMSNFQYMPDINNMPYSKKIITKDQNRANDPQVTQKKSLRLGKQLQIFGPRMQLD